MKVRNISPDLRVIPALGITVDVDEVFTVPTELADREWNIPGVFEVVATPKSTKED